MKSEAKPIKLNGFGHGRNSIYKFRAFKLHFKFIFILLIETDCHRSLMTLIIKWRW